MRSVEHPTRLHLLPCTILSSSWPFRARFISVLQWYTRQNSDFIFLQVRISHVELRNPLLKKKKKFFFALFCFDLYGLRTPSGNELRPYLPSGGEFKINKEDGCRFGWMEQTLLRRPMVLAARALLRSIVISSGLVCLFSIPSFPQKDSNSVTNRRHGSRANSMFTVNINDPLEVKKKERAY